MRMPQGFREFESPFPDLQILPKKKLRGEGGGQGNVYLPKDIMGLKLAAKIRAFNTVCVNCTSSIQNLCRLTRAFTSNRN